MTLRCPARALLLLVATLVPWAGHAADDLLQPARTAREAALQAEAPRLATPAWIRAEEQLRTATGREEQGDARGAARRAEEARVLYASAELSAIKARLLTGAREQVLALEAAGTARPAPRTTARAQELLHAAEAALDADRRQTAVAADLAQQASREAARAQALAGLLRPADRRTASTEDIALEWEATLARAAAAAGLGTLPPGPEAAAGALAAQLATLRQQTDQQAGELHGRTREVAALEEEIRELDARLARTSNEARDLTERIEAGEHARGQYERLASLFTPDQAVVLRQSDAIVLRLVGLAFTPGTARFAPAAKPVLERLRGALDLYPAARFAVEGHTDSSGDSATNQRLSQARAEALRAYLIRDLQMAPGRISAVGHGDSRPVASNASAAGRSQNRRIDLVITTPDPAF